ncbi:Hcp family type VI secretion system effector [Hamadaea tsunoensis]|uniref:Hcp family type VI secretion system effector n=1 Tax=Hamadaea tsunoensis TaxID=53368 RepID=UPI0004219597|nr:type VI secretion system tube protein Hcp [Hamadaea tsunoensis]
MRTLYRLVATAALALATVVTPALPAAAAPRPTVFLKIDGIPGSSADARHKGEIEILSYSFGVANSGSSTGGGGGAGKAVFQDLHVTKHVDVASPKLFLATANGTHLDHVVLTVERARRTGQPLLQVTLENVLVSSFANGGGAGAEPVEQVSFTYQQITYNRF